MTRNRILILTAVFVLAVAVFAVASLMDPEEPTPISVRVLPASGVEWQMLNPLRGDKSPKAGTLWGDRGAPVPCGFLVKFVDGFSSPPHIHPVTYRGVVVSGLVHNDVPEAEAVWLSPGSFWTQPAGEVHITAAKGSENVAYIEIEKGPYLVHPAKDAFERPYAPIKMDPAAMPWADAAGGAQRAPLPGNPQDERMKRALVKLPAAFEGSVRGAGASLHVVVIQGRLTHNLPEQSDATELDAGSYFGSTGAVAHDVTCADGQDCILYVRTEGSFEVTSAKSGN